MGNDGTGLSLVMARTAHVMLGFGLTGSGVVIGYDPGNDSLAAAGLGSGNEIGARLDGEGWTAALCQWDDARSLFVLDSHGRVYDANVPVEGDGDSYSWSSLVDEVFRASRVSKANVIKAAALENFSNIVTEIGMNEAMFYLAAVAYDVDAAQTAQSRKRVIEEMVKDYALIDPGKESLDAIEATTVKAYGGLHMYDLRFPRLAGRWIDWERDLTRLKLPSSQWLALRRATGLLGKVDRNMAGPVVSLFVPSVDGDLTKRIVLDMPRPCVQPWLATLRMWVAPDDAGAWADSARFEWVDEYVKLTNIIMGDEDPWEGMEPMESWTTEATIVLDEIKSMSMEDRLELLSSVWREVLDDVFYPAVERVEGMGLGEESMADQFDDVLLGIQQDSIELNARVLVLASCLTDVVESKRDHDKPAGNGNDGAGVPVPVDDTTDDEPVTPRPMDDSLLVNDSDDASMNPVKNGGAHGEKAGSSHKTRSLKSGHDDSVLEGQEEADREDASVRGSVQEDEGSTHGKHRKGNASSEEESGPVGSSRNRLRSRPTALRRSLLQDQDEDEDAIDYTELVIE